MSLVGPVPRPVPSGTVQPVTGGSAGDESWELRANFVQPSYSVTDTSITEPRLRANFVQDTNYQLSGRPKTGFYFLAESGSDGFYVVRN